MSSAEAEYMAASNNCRDIIELRKILQELHIPLDGPTVMRTDNEACIAIASSERVTRRNKHIDLHFHFIRECVLEFKDLVMEWTSTTDNLADMLTKALPPAVFDRLLNIMFGNEVLHWNTAVVRRPHS